MLGVFELMERNSCLNLDIFFYEIVKINLHLETIGSLHWKIKVSDELNYTCFVSLLFIDLCNKLIVS